MKTILICHDGAKITQEGLSQWLCSFSNLSGIIILKEKQQRMTKRVKREIKRVGYFRFLDVILFRIFYRFFMYKKDSFWEKNEVRKLKEMYPQSINSIPILITHTPNSRESFDFIDKIKPDIMIARCKTLLNEKIFNLPLKGTYVFHPGICPEYRNAHGCFWALAENDLEKVGMTLLRIDKGIDTGPVYGYYSYDYNINEESHIVIQHKVVTENLDKIQKKILDIYNETAIPVNTENRSSNTWGQPWLSKYLKLKIRIYINNK